MKNSIVIIEIEKLKSHEVINPQHLSELVEKIKEDGLLKKPIVVDQESLVVLDGHHRLRALKILGYKKIPAFLVDYRSKDVRVYLRRKELKMQLIKEVVITRGKGGRPLPPKTTRHLLKRRPGEINIDLRALR